MSIQFMRISELRREAYEKGLNVDGSREMLLLLSKKRSQFAADK